MKTLYLVLIVSFVLSCHETNEGIEKTETAVPEIESFDWLLGNWQRTNEEEGKQTFEHWEKKSDSEYLGFGFTMEETDTISFENIRLIKTDTSWAIEVNLPEEAQATVFELTEIDETGFTCENEANEFPKKITYFKEGNALKAIISGGDMEISFDFEKVEEHIKEQKPKIIGTWVDNNKN